MTSIGCIEELPADTADTDPLALDLADLGAWDPEVVPAALTDSGGVTVTLGIDRAELVEQYAGNRPNTFVVWGQPALGDACRTATEYGTQNPEWWDACEFTLGAAPFAVAVYEHTLDADHLRSLWVWSAEEVVEVMADHAGPGVLGQPGIKLYVQIGDSQ
jgi:hypothetical protein